MDLQKRIDLVIRNTAEVVTTQELNTLLETNTSPKAYWGFECSGLLHIGIGLVCSAKIKDMITNTENPEKKYNLFSRLAFMD